MQIREIGVTQLFGAKIVAYIDRFLKSMECLFVNKNAKKFDIIVLKTIKRKRPLQY
jgi:hypothetical protein